MDRFNEEMVAHNVPVVMRVLGVPAETAELAVRHAFNCSERPCMVYEFLLDRITAHTAQLTGISQPEVLGILATATKGAVDTVALRHRLGMSVGYEQLRSAYDNTEPVIELLMNRLAGDARDASE